MTQQAEILVKIDMSRPKQAYSGLAAGDDFVLAPPPSLFGTGSQVPRMLLSRVQRQDDCENRFLVRVLHLATGVVESFYRLDDAFGFAECAGDLVRKYIQYVLARKAETA